MECVSARECGHRLLASRRDVIVPGMNGYRGGKRGSLASIFICLLADLAVHVQSIPNPVHVYLSRYLGHDLVIPVSRTPSPFPFTDLLWIRFVLLVPISSDPLAWRSNFNGILRCLYDRNLIDGLFIALFFDFILVLNIICRRLVFTVLDYNGSIFFATSGPLFSVIRWCHPIPCDVSPTAPPSLAPHLLHLVGPCSANTAHRANKDSHLIGYPLRQTAPRGLWRRLCRARQGWA